MRATHPEFSDHALTQLLDALHARTTAHPENPGLIACWPAVREMRPSWAIAAMADDPVGSL